MTHITQTMTTAKKECVSMEVDNIAGGQIFLFLFFPSCQTAFVLPYMFVTTQCFYSQGLSPVFLEYCVFACSQPGCLISFRLLICVGQCGPQE